LTFTTISAIIYIVEGGEINPKRKTLQELTAQATAPSTSRRINLTRVKLRDIIKMLRGQETGDSPLTTLAPCENSPQLTTTCSQAQTQV